MVELWLAEYENLFDEEIWFELNQEVKEWVSANLRGKVIVDRGTVFFSDNKVLLRFWYEDDAILFKLAWG